MTPGDVVVARRVTRGGNLPHGAMAVWRYRDYARVEDQSDVPWTDNVYRWVLYCEDVETLQTPISEQFNSLPFHQNKFLGAVNRLNGADKVAYIDALTASGKLGDEANATLEAVR